MDIKVNLEPISNNLVHTDRWEGPCRVGPMEEGTLGFKHRVRKKQSKIWYKELQNSPGLTRCNLMGPVYTELDESSVMWDSEFDRLMSENHQADLYLITYHVPGIERLNKPVSITNPRPTLIDLVRHYRDIGLEAYMAHDYEKYNRILTCLQVCEAVANTKILILSNSEQASVSVNTSCCNLISLFTRYDIHHNRTDFKQAFNYFDKIPTDKGIHQEVKALMEGADEADITEEYLCSNLRYLHAMRRMTECCDHNAFTTPYKELCVSRLPQGNKCVLCITHSLNKDGRIPPACEEDLAVWMAMVMMICLIHQSAFIGNPVLVLAGSRILEQLGISKLLIQPGQIFDHDILEIHHVVPVRRVREFGQPEQRYESARSTTQDWGAHYHVDMVEEKEQVVTFDRFSRQDIRMMVAVGYALGCELRLIYYSSAVYYEVEGGARELRQALVKGGHGHHQAIVYDNHIKELQELSEIMGSEVEVFHQSETRSGPIIKLLKSLDISAKRG